MIAATSRGTHTIADPILSATQNQQAPKAFDRSFEEIMSDYWDNPERGSALDYLKGLSHTELQTVGREHGFANPTPNLYGLDLEGTNNLLRLRGETKDENGDGIYNVGESRTWRFPNDSTPPSVAAAWEEATESMTDSEAMLAAGVLYMPLPQVHTDPLTGHTRVISPGEPGYQKDPASNSASYYESRARNALAALDDPSNPPSSIEYYRQAKAFYTKLLNAFEGQAVS